ncbi:unnamed protein product [Cylicocyclus nassatus]|uniref:Uncharacterized protein n=1 Tax=Cylicocyclus nassatus TaxID=53992 RepID=A0AA36GK63_CYLNA|nr:unnamed protein product [Cylicocyclus nassatus]
MSEMRSELCQLENIAHHFRPRKYFARGVTTSYGPFHDIPAASEFPPGMFYLIAQKIAVLPSGRVVFRGDTAGLLMGHLSCPLNTASLETRWVVVWSDSHS